LYCRWEGRRLHVEIRGAEKLSFRERQVVALKESGSSAAEIAGRLQVTEATVATLYRRARAKGYLVVIVLDAGVLGLDEFADSLVEE
jgi:DNA-binding CsgD family transcriptional regulator